MSLKRKFKNDLKKDVDLSFDNSALESNVKPSKSRIKIITSRIVAACILVPLSIVIIAPIVFVIATMKDSVSDAKRTYTLNEIRNLSSTSFKSLNSISYPHITNLNEFNHDEKEAYLNYVDKIYKNLDPSQNMMFSPLTLYGFFTGSYKALSNEEYVTKYENLLGLNENQLISFYKKMFENNYFANNDGIVQLHNGVFIDTLNDECEISEKYIDYLTKVYTDCYSMDFKNNKDVDLMIKWINQSIGETNFITKNDIPATSDTIIGFFSTMNFNLEWKSKFVKKNTYDGKFFIDSSTSVSTKYMTHNFGSYYYDYGKYISVHDYYSYSYSITYIVPKSIDDNIYDLIGDKNLFIEDAEQIYEPNIELHVPKFNITKMIDFKKLITNLGMPKMFDYPNNALGNVYEEGKGPGPVFLEALKQKNTIKLNEDGTIIKSVNIGMAGTAKAGEGNALVVNLNQPFIYIVKDSSGMPIYVGHIDNPTIE